MKFRIVALYKNSDGYYEDLTMVLSEHTGDDDLLLKLREIEGLHYQDYIVDSCIITTDDNVYRKKALEASLTVLRTTTELFKKHLDRINELDNGGDIYKETKRLQEEHEKTMMKTVALRCSRCITRDIEVTDELALQCYDLYKGNKL